MNKNAIESLGISINMKIYTFQFNTHKLKYLANSKKEANELLQKAFGINPKFKLVEVQELKEKQKQIYELIFIGE